MLRRLTETEFIETCVRECQPWLGTPEGIRRIALARSIGALELLAWESDDHGKMLLCIHRIEAGDLMAVTIAIEESADAQMLCELLPYLQAHYAGETFRTTADMNDPLVYTLAELGFVMEETQSSWYCDLENVALLDDFEDEHVVSVTRENAEAFQRFCQAAGMADMADEFLQADKSGWAAYLYDDVQGIAGAIVCQYGELDCLTIHNVCCQDRWNPAIPEALLLTVMAKALEHGCETAYRFNCSGEEAAVLRDLGFRRGICYASYYKKL